MPPRLALGAGGVRDGLAQAARTAVMAIIETFRHDGMNRVMLFTAFRELIMTLLLLEALGALLLLVFIVWWTMFSGRQKGELKDRSVDAALDTEDKEKK